MFVTKHKEDKFYAILLKSSSIVNESAAVLLKSLNDLSKKTERVKETSKLEDEGDELVRTLTKELDEAFVTPIDREDLYSIVKEMDNILDNINSIIHRFIMFDIHSCSEEIKSSCTILHKATTELNNLMQELETNGCRSKKLIDIIMNISRIESEGDKVFRAGVTKLFKFEKDPITVMKWKEIYQITENTIDDVEKVANIVEGVVIKNA